VINYGKHYIDKSDLLSVLKTLKNGNLTQGNQIFKFESSLNKYFGSKYACVLSNATAGLYLLSELLNWKKNDVIFLSPLTFLAGANSVARSGAKPFFIDIDLKNYNMDLNILEMSLKKNANNAKAIIATDYSGIPCDWRSLRYLANKYKCSLINDNCHAMGTKYYGNTKYAIRYADFVVQSYHAVKNFTTGEGGSVLLNNKEIHKQLAMLRTHGIYKTDHRKNKKQWLYDIERIGYNFRLTDIQASLGISQIKKLNKFVNKRLKIAKVYDEFFLKFQDFHVPFKNKHFQSSYHLYPLLINFKRLNKKKEDLFTYLKKSKINLQVHYIPTYRFKFYKKKYDYNFKSFPNTEFFYKNALSLPIYFDLKIKDQKKILKNIKNFFGI